MNSLIKNNSGKIVEIIGPPGVGKSTIFKFLCEEWNSKQNWIYPDALLASPNPGLTNFSKWLDYNFRVLLGRKRSKSIPIEFGMRFINNNKEFATICWNHLSNSESHLSWEIDNRFRSAYFLFYNFCKHQAIIEAKSNKICIIDEGFLQKSFLINDNEQSLLFFDEYLSLSPLPQAVLYVDIKKTGIIADRLMNREKTITFHRGKNTNELFVETKRWQGTLLHILDKLENKNIKIFEINGEDSIQENVHVIKKILKAI